MIPHDYITEWRAQAPWIQDFQVEMETDRKPYHFRLPLSVGRYAATQAASQDRDQLEGTFLGIRSKPRVFWRIFALV